MEKRMGQLAVLVTAFALALAACQPGAGASPSAAKPDKLTIAAVEGNESLGIEALAPTYEQETGIALEIVKSPYPQLYEKLVTTFQANDATFDLVMLDDPWMPKFGTDGSLQALDTTYGFQRDADIAGVIYDVGTWPPPRGAVPPSEVDKDQQLLGITVVGNVEMFVYRSDLMEEPATWDDVLAAAEENDSDQLAGYVVRGAATNPVVADFLPILWSFGGDVFDEDWKVVIDSEESLAAITFLVEDLKAVGQEGPENTDAADRARLIAIGEGLQSTIWPGEVAGITNDPEVSTQRENLAYIPMPAGPSGKGFGMMGNWLLAIPKAAANGQAAADFIRWMTESDTQRAYAEAGGIPSRTSILTDEGLNENNPYFAPLAESLAAGPNWRPRTDQWNAVEAILGTELNAALAGLKTPDEAASSAAEQIRTLMQGAGYPS